MKCLIVTVLQFLLKQIIVTGCLCNKSMRRGDEKVGRAISKHTLKIGVCSDQRGLKTCCAEGSGNGIVIFGEIMDTK